MYKYGILLNGKLACVLLWVFLYTTRNYDVQLWLYRCLFYGLGGTNKPNSLSHAVCVCVCVLNVRTMTVNWINYLFFSFIHSFWYSYVVGVFFVKYVKWIDLFFRVQIFLISCIHFLLPNITFISVVYFSTTNGTFFHKKHWTFTCLTNINLFFFIF